MQVHAAEHFSALVHGWTCSAVPVHHPEDGRLLGVIDLTGPMTRAHPRTLAAVMAAARAVEADLRVRTQVRDAQLRVRYLDRIAPILVEGRVWGAILATSTRRSPFDHDTESRLMGFAELVATALSNAVSLDELNASRARILAAADDSRRRIERALHDGAQQRLVALCTATARGRR